MYFIYYGNDLIHDPISETLLVFDAQCSGGLNEYGTLEFSISPKHPLYSQLTIRDKEVRLYHDSDLLFTGYIVSFDDSLDMERKVVVNGEMSYLGDVRIRPYSTVETDDEAILKAPSSPADLFVWYIEQYNAHASHPFMIGENQAALLDENETLYRESAQYPSVADEIQDKLIDSIGGYLFIKHEGDNRVLEYYADVYSVNSQIIDFGQNLLNFTHSRTAEETYTAIVPSGATYDVDARGNPIPEDDHDTEVAGQHTVTLKDLADSEYKEFRKEGDALIDVAALSRFGYREYYVDNTDITTPEYLELYAAVLLREMHDISDSVDVRAIDLAMYMPEYKHLRAGEVVRVRATPFDVDQYMVVKNITLDLNNPENTEFSLGITYDSLTGQQSATLLRMNATINAAYDQLPALSAELKNTAITANAAQAAGIRLEASLNDMQGLVDAMEDQITDMRGLIDGSISTWFYEYMPATNNEPAVNWTTADEKNEHLGDLFYDTTTGYAYRWMATTNEGGQTTWSWGRITDTDVTTALAMASNAQDTADSKRRVFYETPTPPYDEGDLWVQGENGDIYFCGVAKASGTSYAATDWSLASKYAKSVTSTVQLWFTSPSNEKPIAPTAHVTTNDPNTQGAWNIAIPNYNSSYSHYFYCYEYKYANGNYGWSTVIQDVATEDAKSTGVTAQNAAGTAQAAANDAQTAADNAQTTADNNIKYSVLLRINTDSNTAPSAPTAHVTTNDPSISNAWNLAVPTYNASYPYYFYCYEYQKGDGTYTWSEVLPDTSNTETQQTSRNAAQAASDAQTAVGNANAQEQLIYISQPSGTNSVQPNTTWVTESGDVQNTWTTKRPTYSPSYPVLFVATQRQSVDQSGGTVCTCTTPVKDDTLTVIDGGHITTGTIDASVVTVTNIDASQITVGSIDMSQLDQTVQDDINSGASAGQLAAGSVQSSVMLWYASDNTTAPSAPTEHITRTSDTGGAWTLTMPGSSTSYPYYFYCYEYLKGDGTYSWSAVQSAGGLSDAIDIANQALDDVSDAAKTATNYITYISASSGIKIHSAANATTYAQLTSSALKFYYGGTQYADIGSTITLGNTSGNQYAQLTSSDFSITGKSGSGVYPALHLYQNSSDTTRYVELIKNSSGGELMHYGSGNMKVGVSGGTSKVNLYAMGGVYASDGSNTSANLALFDPDNYAEAPENTSKYITTGVYLEIYGNVCVLQVNKSVSLDSNWATASLGTVPSGYRPRRQVYAAAVYQNNWLSNIIVTVATNGAITAGVQGGSYSPDTSPATLLANLTWIVA